MNQHTFFLDETEKEDPTQGIPDWLQPFTDNLEDLETDVLADSSERENSGSEGDASKVETQKTEAQYSYSLHQITEGDLFREQKSMVTW